MKQFFRDCAHDVIKLFVVWWTGVFILIAILSPIWIPLLILWLTGVVS